MVRMLLMLLLSGCVTLINRDGFALVQSEWAENEVKIRARASFDFPCAADQLTIQVISIFGGAYPLAEQVGVSGCGKRMVYVNSRSGWVANSSSGESR